MESDEIKFRQALLNVKSENRRPIFSSIIGTNISNTLFYFNQNSIGNAMHAFLFNLDKNGVKDFMSVIRDMNMSDVKTKRAKELYNRLMTTRNAIGETPRDVIISTQKMLDFFSDFLSKKLRIKELEQKNEENISTVLNMNPDNRREMVITNLFINNNEFRSNYGNIIEINIEAETIRTAINQNLQIFDIFRQFPLYQKLNRLSELKDLFENHRINQSNYFKLATRIEQVNDTVMDIAGIMYPQTIFHKPDFRSVIDGTMRMTGVTRKIPNYRR